nr:hypothetical protein [Tanacetum cinerariifolium]
MVGCTELRAVSWAGDDSWVGFYWADLTFLIEVGEWAADEELGVYGIEGSEFDEDDETTPVENNNCKVDKFWSMPLRLKTPVLDMKKKRTPKESFAELPLYCHNLKVKNPGTITHIETDDEDRFEIFFLAVGAAIRTFVSHIRPLIIIDGAHLKGKSETFRSWDWFLRKLKECIIGKQDNLTIISDGAASIASAINNVFPNAFHGRCCRHLLMNLRKKCPQFISKEELFWKACKAYRILDFKERFSTLHNWLPSVGLEKWARVHFPEWEQPDGLITVLSPLMDKRPSGRPRNRDCFRPKGEQIKQKSCTRCFRGGHNRRDCPSMVPSHIFIPITSTKIKEGGPNYEMLTQEYVRKITEEPSDDDHFTHGPWLSAVQYLAVEGSIATGCFGDMKTFIKNGKVEKVVAVIKSCTSNMLGDLTVTLKDLLGIIAGTIHYKVLNDEGYRKAISIGAVLILRNVSVFS